MLYWWTAFFQKRDLTQLAYLIFFYLFRAVGMGRQGCNFQVSGGDCVISPSITGLLSYVKK